MPERVCRMPFDSATRAVGGGAIPAVVPACAVAAGLRVPCRARPHTARGCGQPPGHEAVSCGHRRRRGQLARHRPVAALATVENTRRTVASRAERSARSPCAGEDASPHPLPHPAAWPTRASQAPTTGCISVVIASARQPRSSSTCPFHPSRRRTPGSPPSGSTPTSLAAGLAISGSPTRQAVAGSCHSSSPPATSSSSAPTPPPAGGASGTGCSTPTSSTAGSRPRPIPRRGRRPRPRPTPPRRRTLPPRSRIGRPRRRRAHPVHA